MHFLASFLSRGELKFFMKKFFKEKNKKVEEILIFLNLLVFISYG